MHPLFASSDAVPVSTCARDVVMVPGPSSQSVHLAQGEQALNVSQSVTYVVLNDHL